MNRFKQFLARQICKSGTKCIYGYKELVNDNEVGDLAKGDIPKTVEEWCPHCEGDTKHYFDDSRGFVCVACNKTGNECFITTAICKSMNLPDDCYELNILRMFRDNYMKREEFLKLKVCLYYKIAPKIVKEIDKSPDRMKIYDELYKKYIIKAIKHIEKNEYEMASNIYVKMVVDLLNKYKSAT